MTRPRHPHHRRRAPFGVAAALGLVGCAHAPPIVGAEVVGARAVVVPMVRERRPAVGAAYLAMHPVCAPCARARGERERLVRCEVVSDVRGPLIADADRETAASWTQASYGVVCRFEQAVDRAR